MYVDFPIPLKKSGTPFLKIIIYILKKEIFENTFIGNVHLLNVLAICPKLAAEWIARH